jgi:hypothetical protein
MTLRFDVGIIAQECLVYIEKAKASVVYAALLK